MSLDRFKKPIEIAREVIDEKYTAYKMDSTDKESDMRKAVGLGTCKCCDYFLPRNESIILIEETQLPKKVEEIREEYAYLEDEKKINEIVNDKITDDLHLKAYGAMLVLCRLSATCTSARELFDHKKYQFWLVASKIETPDEKMYFDNQKDTLKGDLTSVIGKILLEDVNVWSAEDLKIWLSNNATTP